jgi:hypothetical protein
MGKPGQNHQANSEEKGKNILFYFLVKMTLYILSIPKCKNIFRSALKYT